MEPHRVSIIVIVYNKEQTLPRCLDSILYQTYEDWECILIDDGSTDGSPFICDEYSRRDRRFVVFHQPNQGVSMARKKGIKTASGNYSIHVDADDYIDGDMIEAMYHSITEQSVDILVADYWLEGSNSKKRVRQKPSGDNSSALATDILMDKLHGGLWNKMIRHSCYLENNIRFYPEINYCEDVLVLAQLGSASLSVGYIDLAPYHYCINNSSITSRKNFSYRAYQALKDFYNKLAELPYLPAYAIEYTAQKIKLSAVKARILPRKEFYSFSKPALSTGFLFRRPIDKLFFTLTYFHLYHIGLALLLLWEKCVDIFIRKRL